MAETSRFVKPTMKATSALSTGRVITKSLKADDARSNSESGSDSSTGLTSSVAEAQQGTSLLR